jgi:integrase
LPTLAVPKALVKILDRDLKMAGIAKRDERGRTIDVHAMRHTFGTLLSKGGLPHGRRRPPCVIRRST